MIDIDQYRQLKRKVDEARSTYERANGALSQLMEKLKEDFNCESIDEANELLQKKIKMRDSAEKEFQQALDQFNTKWADKLEQLN